jgi:NADH-quinone oxidoreductase subunit N
MHLYNKYQSCSAEIILFFTIILSLFSFFFLKRENKARFISILSIIGCAFAIYALPYNFQYDELLHFNQMYLINKNNSIIKILVLIGVIFAHLSIVLMPSKKNGIDTLANFELPLLINFSSLGILFAISSNNFLILYLSLELQALPAYILTAIKRDSNYSLEGGVKYFVLGVFASSIFLYGISLIYISSGTISYDGIANLLMKKSTEISPMMMIGIIFVMFGLLFKLAAAPLHKWIGDVYQSAHGTILTFFSSVPKIGIAYVIYILYHFVFVGKYFQYNTTLIGIFVFFSLLIGSLGAIKQTNFKRLIAYSAIANSGFLLLNILGDLTYSFTALVIYSLAYMIASYGLISFVMYYWNEDENLEHKNYLISDLSGFVKEKSWLSASLVILLLSIAGIPPFIGFFGKLYVLMSSVSALHLVLTFVALMTSVISLIYYLGIIKVIYFADRKISMMSQQINLSRYELLTIFYAICAIVTIYFLNNITKFLI